MRHNQKKLFLLFIFIVSLVLFFLLDSVFTDLKKRNDYQQMKEARLLTQKWFQIICKEKEQRGITSEVNSKTTYSGMLGSEYSLTTTTLGSLKAKELSCNPDFSALLVRLINEAEIEKEDTVLILSSGSFPALMISTLSAIKTLDLKAIIISSLGASMYGANQPQATWIDMENWLRKYDDFPYSSNILTLGGENDNGGGLTDEGIILLKNAANRNNVKLTIPQSYEEAIKIRLKILQNRDISLLINIGGNQTSLGRDNHSLNIPNGLVNSINISENKDRGILMRSIELGIPYIHLLGIKDLALEYGIKKYLENIYKEPEKLYMNRYVSILSVIISILIIFLLIFWFKKGFN